MKAALFCTSRYMGAAPEGVWPTPAATYSTEVATRSYNTTLEQFGLADETGFDWVTVAEHHFSPFALTPNPMVFAGALTQIVKRAKIALLGATIPILNPIRVAEEVAMLDTLTNGRIVAGMLRGTGNEYVTYNYNPSESRARFEEAIDLIKMAWTEPQPFGWEGRFFQYRSVSVWPRPVQAPHPPIYMSASSPESGDYAAKNKVGIGFAFTSVPQAKVAANHYRERAHAYGWDPHEDDVIYRVGVHVADTDEQAYEDLEEAAKGPRHTGLSTANRAVEAAVKDAGYYGQDVEGQRGRLFARGSLKDRIATGQLLIGSVDTVTKQIQDVKREMGCGILDFTLVTQLGQRTLHAIELLGEKIVPRMHEM